MIGSSGGKPGGVSFATFAGVQADYLPGRNLKPSTVSDYGSIITGRLIPFFGDTDIARIDAVAVDAYIFARHRRRGGAEDGEEPPRRPSRHVQGGAGAGG